MSQHYIMFTFVLAFPSVIACRCSFVCEYSAIIPTLHALQNLSHLPYIWYIEAGVYIQSCSILLPVSHSFVCAQHHSLILCALKVHVCIFMKFRILFLGVNSHPLPSQFFTNPWHACAARVSVLRLRVYQQTMSAQILHN